MPDMTLKAHGAHYIAPDIHGQNFFAIDRQFQDLMSLYMEPGLRAQMTPHFDRLGALAGNRLDELAQTADKHPPVLQPRDRFGRDEDWIDYHPSYREMEKIAFEEFGMHAMSHRAGVLGMSGAGASAGEVRHHLSLRAGRVRPDVPGLGVRHLQLHDQALRLARAEEAAARPAAEPGPGDDAEGHAVHDREGRRLRRRRDRDRGRADRCRRRRRRALEPARPEMVLQPCRCRCRRAARPPARRRAGHARPRHVRPAAAARGRQPQPLPDRAAEGQARHALDGVGRDHPRRRDGLSGRRRRAGLQADDGAGQPVAAQPRRARRVDDAALPQRGAGRRARPPRLRQGDRRVSAAAPPADEDHAADRAGAVDVRLLRRHDGTRPTRATRTPRTCCASSRRSTSSAPAATTSRSPARRSRCAAASATSRNG